MNRRYKNVCEGCDKHDLLIEISTLKERLKQMALNCHNLRDGVEDIIDNNSGSEYLQVAVIVSVLQQLLKEDTK